MTLESPGIFLFLFCLVEKMYLSTNYLALFKKLAVAEFGHLPAEAKPKESNMFSLSSANSAWAYSI
jgi:hypothetical protein